MWFDNGKGWFDKGKGCYSITKMVNFCNGEVQGLKSQEVISFDNELRLKAVYNKRETLLKKIIIVILYSVSNCISYHLPIRHTIMDDNSFHDLKKTAKY